MRLIAWLNNTYPEGFYKIFGQQLSILEQRTSLNRYVNKKLNGAVWVSEFCQLISLAFGLACLVSAGSLPQWLRYLLAVPLSYRVYEIFLFAINWFFTHPKPPRSYKRSLVGFLLNFGELVIYFAFGYFISGSVKDGTPWTAFYSSLRTAVTIGPTNFREECWYSVLILSLQIVVSYFLIVVVVASVVGTITNTQKK